MLWFVSVWGAFHWIDGEVFLFFRLLIGGIIRMNVRGLQSRWSVWKLCVIFHSRFPKRAHCRWLFRQLQLYGDYLAPSCTFLARFCGFLNLLHLERCRLIDLIFRSLVSLVPFNDFFLVREYSRIQGVQRSWTWDFIELDCGNTNAIVKLSSLLASNHGSYLFFTSQMVVLEDRTVVLQIWLLSLALENK